MMIGTVGERALGIQVGQIDAVAKWACQQYGVQRVHLHSSGWTAGIAALMVAGLNPDRIDRVVVQNGLPSLKTTPSKIAWNTSSTPRSSVSDYWNSSMSRS